MFSNLFSPFSSSALASLPAHNPRGIRDRSTRTDHIPEPPSESAGPVTNVVEHALRRDYHAINDALPPGVRIPTKIATPIKVEAKVWFANERSGSL
jgi:hypothetical protein